ncbi:MAG: metalloregulator ArsR/SmtB family transcription factor [Pseudomonadota bacterium]
MDRQSQVFRALADQNRRILLDLLLESDRSVGELSKKLTISQPAVSQHLQILREAGLVSHHKEGRQNIYSVDAEPLLSAADWLSKYSKFWDEKIDALKDLLARKKN